ncbi:MAG: hypothetical protein LBU60_06415 [Clostridiales bacterium]|jgi:3-isopropylmalate dehydrogenase|nr:hypothetical protein [Clostridiales bacterium]
MEYKIALLPGDGHGVNLIQSVVDILSAIKVRFGHTFKFLNAKIGGDAIDNTGVSLPQDTVDICKKCDAVFIGSIGGAKWTDNLELDKSRKSIQRLFGALKMSANITPIISFESIRANYPLKKQLLKNDINMYFVSENFANIVGDRGFKSSAKQGIQAYDTEIISKNQIEQLSNIAFDIAKTKKIPIISVDMSDQLESGFLWRQTVDNFATQYPSVPYQHMLAQDFVTMLNTQPNKIKLVLTNASLGSLIVSQAVSITNLSMVATGVIGCKDTINLENAKLGIYGTYNFKCHDNFPNPIGIVLSIALMLSGSLNLYNESYILEQSVKQVLKKQKPNFLTKPEYCKNITQQIALQIINSV